MTQAIAGYKKLLAWQEAHALVLLVYKATKQFPRDEMFGLTSQIRRAVVSVAANIVEGQGRTSKKEFLQFLSISNGSLVEVEYYLDLTKDLSYITQEQFFLLSQKHHHVGALIHGLMRSLRS